MTSGSSGFGPSIEVENNVVDNQRKTTQATTKSQTSITRTFFNPFNIGTSATAKEDTSSVLTSAASSILSSRSTSTSPLFIFETVTTDKIPGELTTTTEKMIRTSIDSRVTANLQTDANGTDASQATEATRMLTALTTTVPSTSSMNKKVTMSLSTKAIPSVQSDTTTNLRQMTSSDATTTSIATSSTLLRLKL